MSAEPNANGDAFANLVEKWQSGVSTVTTQVTQGKPGGSIPSGWTAEHVLALSGLVLVFGLIVFGIMAYLVSRRLNHLAVLKICALPLIIVSAIFLVIVGYSAEQVAPVLGLLGSIAGYLLGSASHQGSEPVRPPDRVPPSAAPPPSESESRPHPVQ
jgi:hypothetical protein